MGRDYDDGCCEQRDEAVGWCDLAGGDGLGSWVWLRVSRIMTVMTDAGAMGAGVWRRPCWQSSSPSLLRASWGSSGSAASPRCRIPGPVRPSTGPAIPTAWWGRGPVRRTSIPGVHGRVP